MVERDLVLVTGASGFLGSHCVKALLDEGFDVRCTVRSLANERKVAPVRALGSSDRLEIVQADVLRADDWPSAVHGCRFVLHVASPVPLMEPEEPDDILRPAIDGTMNVVRACAQSTSVQRVVMTSSITAISFGHRDDGTKVYNEDDWTDIDQADVLTYEKSKVKAERMAWQFVADWNAQGSRQLELVTLCAGLILGPVLHDNDFATSIVVRSLLNRDTPIVTDVEFPLVDVRDTARAHVRAIQRAEAAGQRVLLTTQPGTNLKQIARCLANEFNPQGYWVPTLAGPFWLLWLLSFISVYMNRLLPFAAMRQRFSTAKMESVLGLSQADMTAPSKTCIDMAYSMIERGLIGKKEYSVFGRAIASYLYAPLKQLSWIFSLDNSDDKSQ